MNKNVKKCLSVAGITFASLSIVRRHPNLLMGKFFKEYEGILVTKPGFSVNRIVKSRSKYICDIAQDPHCGRNTLLTWVVL